ncbi:MAG: hypothetical protein J6U68_04170 [Clostridia bacterium]|nr:hypothetical protein [Clostridia bacterium]
MKTCENCFHYGACLLNGEYLPSPCRKYTDKTDVVEVVRCKDCVYCDLDGRCEALENGLIREYVKPDDYCSYGRKE